MALATGARLGPYGIQSALGAGGMGEVYKARDTRLDRTVAVKVLPEHVATDPELKQRFEGEARTLAALNHPHICHIHDVGSQDGIDFLVMEYLEGETLARRLTKGALPLGQALEVGIQIADALDKAHRQGIVHRDLKPGNIMLTKGGAKLLDFGLAKHRRPSALGVVASSTTTTQSDPVTVPGTLIGTLAYMAPEQLEGKEADARTDIFAFGAVLYEMITGRRAFEGDNQASLIASVLKSKPTALSVLQPMTPPALDHVVERCLERDPDDRWQTASDVMREVRWAATAGTVLTGIASERRLQRRFGVVVGWAVAAAITTGIVVWSRSQSATPPPHPPIRVTIETEVPIADGVLIGAVSPDGRTIVYVGERDRMRRLYRRSLNSLVSTPIPGTEGAINPFFSPDGQWVGFATTAQLKKVALGGGAPVTLCDVPLSAGGSWGLDGSIVFGQATGGLMQISDAGGAPRALTASDSDADAAHWFPQILPGGRAVLFLARTGGIAGVISVLNLDTGQQKRLVEGTQPRFVSPGHIVFARGDSLWAMPFDLDRLDVVGQGFPVLEGIRLNTGGVADFAVGDDGTLIYVAGELTDSTLVWVDRNGREVPAQIAAPLEAARFPRLSPDGRRLAIVLGRRGEGRLWIYDLQGQPPTKLTFEGDALAPVWAPSGERLIFSSWLSQPKRQFWSSPLLSVAWGAPNASSTDPVTTDGYHHPHAFAPDGREIIFTAVDNRGSGDIMALELGTRAEARTVVQSFANEGRGGAALSADGRWLAYTSDVTAREEVWVRPYPAPGAPQRISPNGGREPVWSRGSRELFYLEGDKMMAVAIDINASLRFKPPMMLFEQQYAGRQGQPPSYDVAADGRFLMIKSSQDTVGIRKLVVIINWLEELKRLVPVN